MRAARLVLAAGLLFAGCGEDDSPGAAQGTATGAATGGATDTVSGALAAGGPVIHLADLLEQAQGESGSPTDGARQPRVWRFDAPADGWRVFGAEQRSRLAAVTLEPRPTGLRLALAPTAEVQGMLRGGVFLELDGGRVEDWSAVLVRVRSHERFSGIAVTYNLDDERAIGGGFQFMMGGEGTSPVFNDGSVQDYLLPLRPREPGESLRSLGLIAGAPGPAALELQSLALIPRGAEFDRARDVRSVTRAGQTRTTLYAHTPARLTWTLTVPAGGRLDLGLACLPGDAVSYRITARAAAPSGAQPDAQSGAERDVLLDERIEDGASWSQRTVGLAAWAGASIALTLEADSERPGAVALWGAPIVSGSTPAAASGARPNVILYVIDGGGADFMSVYGYDRPTTPFLERLAREAVVFERAYSNSTWTQPSTASFMTGLQHSVLGGLRRGLHSTPVPVAAPTMAERLRRGGWQTGVFTTNPNAARVIGLERGVDLMHDLGGGQHSASAALLAGQFADFRRDYPGQPYWAHFQTTDVHEPNEPVAPFAGLYVSEAEASRLDEWDEALDEAAGDAFGTTSINAYYDLALERTGISRQDYYGLRRSLYDETMTQQDRQLERFVQGLKESGEWERTLLVITADHGHPAGTFARFGRGLLDPQPEPWQGALCDSFATRVPLIIAWPGRIAGGRRIAQPVSLVDLLPTILELTGQPRAEVSMGHSLAPLLLAQTPQRSTELAAALPPVVLDEFRVDEASGAMIGNLELIDGRWGASLEIGPLPPGADPTLGRHAIPSGGRWGAVHPFFPDVPRLLLYDLAQDPFTAHAVNAEHPELVERYRERLLALWAEHRALIEGFHETAGSPLSPEQVGQLEALGYTGR